MKTYRLLAFGFLIITNMVFLVFSLQQRALADYYRSEAQNEWERAQIEIQHLEEIVKLCSDENEKLKAELSRQR